MGATLFTAAAYLSSHQTNTTVRSNIASVRCRPCDITEITGGSLRPYLWLRISWCSNCKCFFLIDISCTMLWCCFVTFWNVFLLHILILRQHPQFHRDDDDEWHVTRSVRATFYLYYSRVAFSLYVFYIVNFCMSMTTRLLSPVCYYPTVSAVTFIYLKP